MPCIQRLVFCCTAGIQGGEYFKFGHLEQLILRFPKASWDWRYLSINKSISNKFILEHTNLPWIINYLLSVREFTWEQILTLRAPKSYNYTNAYWNPNITPEVVAKHPNIHWNRTELLQNPNFNISHYSDYTDWNINSSSMASLNPNIYKSSKYEILWDFVQARTDIYWRYRYLSKHIPLEVILNNLDKEWDYNKLMKRFHLPISYDAEINKEIINNLPKSAEEAWSIVIKHSPSKWRMSRTYIIKYAPLAYAQKEAKYHNGSILSNRAVTHPVSIMDAQRALELHNRFHRSQRFAIPLEIDGLDSVEEINFKWLIHSCPGNKLSEYRGLRWSNVVNNPNIGWDFNILSRNTFSVIH